MGENPRIEELRRRVQSDPASLAFAPLAEEYRRLGRFGEAISICEVGLNRYPSYVSARVTLARILAQVGRLDDARREFEGVLHLAPENLTAIRALAEIHQSKGPVHGGDPDVIHARPQRRADLDALERFLAAVRAARISDHPPR